MVAMFGITPTPAGVDQLATQQLTVVVDGVGDDWSEGARIVSTVILQEHLDTEAHHVEVVLFSLQQLLLGHWTHNHTWTYM